MSTLDTLITALRPRGVLFRPLGEIAACSDTRTDAAQLDKSCFVGVDNLLPNRGGKVDATYLPNTARLTAYMVGDVLLGNIRPYLKKVWLADNDGGCSGDVLAIRIKPESRGVIAPEFLYYLLAADSFFRYDMQHAKGAKMPRGSKAAILKYLIPVPSLEVQREIVQVLDTFTKLETELEAKLEAELEARRQQYTYYRDELLSFKRAGGDIAWTTLGEVGTFTRGRRFTKDDYTADGIACIHYGDIYTRYGTSAVTTVSRVRTDMAEALRFAHPGDVIVAAVGETVEDVGKAVAWLGNENVAVHDDCFAFRHSMNPKFVSYYLQTRAFNAEKAKFVARAKMKRLSGENLAKLRIPVPPLGQQARLVDILDKFDKLVTDLSVGLPTELKARRQQYEYYRDRLLTFREAA